MGTRHLLSVLEHQFEHSGCGVGPHSSFCGTFTGPISQIEGLFTLLTCIPAWSSAWPSRTPCLASRTRASRGSQWGCPIKGCGRWVLGPWDVEGHTAAEHPGWTATDELLRPYPNQRQRVVYRRNAPPAS